MAEAANGAAGPQGNHQAPDRLMRRYLLALGSIALAMAAAQLTLQPEFIQQGERVLAANLVGLQRVHAARLSEQALLCQLDPGGGCAGSLEAGLVALEQSHRVADQAAAAALRGELDGVDQQLARVRERVRAAVADPVAAQLDALRAACVDFRAAVDQALVASAAKVAARTLQIRLVAGGFFAAVLVLMLLQALLVFRPAVRGLAHQLAAMEKARAEVQASLEHVKQLQGLLPICMHCKRIRDDQQNWQRIESYLEKHTDASFTHALCAECLEKHYPEKE